MSEYKELFYKIQSLVSINRLFGDFKFNKRNCCLTYRKNGCRKDVYLTHWKDNVNQELIISPVFSVTYDVLLSWFKKYSLLSLQDQRDNYSFGFASRMLGCASSIYRFKINGIDFDLNFNHFKDELLRCSNWVFENYGTLELAYQNEIIPLLNKSKEFPDGGIEWAFIDLTLCKIVAPENYEMFKSMVLNRISFLHSRNEPNVLDYYDNLNEIITFMEGKTVGELNKFKI